MENTKEALEGIRTDLEKLQETKRKVYITINDGRLKVSNASSEIIGVYEHFVILKSDKNGYNQTYTIKIVDFMTGKAVIKDQK